VIARTTRRWGTFFLAAGIFQLIGAQPMAHRDPVWGVVLILAGAASFIFRSASMLAAFGVLIAWVMVSNLLSGNWYGMVSGAVQAFLAFGAFRGFLFLRRATSRLDMGLAADSPAQSDRAAGVFPFAGCAFTIAAFIGIIGLIVGTGVWYALNEQEPSEQALGTAMVFLTDLACRGLALAVAALLARYRFRGVSTLAVVGGALLLAGVPALTILG